MGGSEVPVILSAVLTTVCRDSQSEALQAPHQTEMQLVSMLCSVSIGCGDDGRGEVCSLHPVQKVGTAEPSLQDQDKVSVICTPRNLVLLTSSTAVLLVTSGV